MLKSLSHWRIVCMSIILWISSLTCFVLIGVIFVSISFVLNKNQFHRLARLSAHFILLASGQRIDVKDSFPPLERGPYLYVFNHTSMLDSLIMVAAIPHFMAAVGKREQFAIPLWGAMLRRWGAVPLDRADRSSAIQSLSTVEEVIRHGTSLLISPEGTRSSDGELLPFKKGPFHIALNTGISIVPIAVTGAYHSKNKTSWILRPNTIEIRIGQLVIPHMMTMPTVEELNQLTRHNLEVAIKRGFKHKG